MAWSIRRNRTEQDAPPIPLGPSLGKPEDYYPSDELLHATSVAIRLGAPLLLTGDPGTGKSSFADYLANHLNPKRKSALRVNARSNMELKDLYYSYDDVASFRDAPRKAPSKYLTLNGLGEAILRGSDLRAFGNLRGALLRDGEKQITREVVLIDEIDKAPRDVPNDLLSRLSGAKINFEIPEVLSEYPEAAEISAYSENLPIIVCTSNSERALPDAFLRRCIYFHIELPEGDNLMRIVDARIWGDRRGRHTALVQSAEDLLRAIIEASPPPRKKPGLAELLDFLLMLRAEVPEHYDKKDTSLRANRTDWQEIAKITLLKTLDDRRQAERLLNLRR